MTPGSHGDREVFPISEIKGMTHLGRSPALRYDRRPAVYHRVIYTPGLVVTGVMASDEVHGQSPSPSDPRLASTGSEQPSIARAV